MANYQNAYPALPGLASGAPDSPAAAIAAGAPLNDGDMDAATRQAKRRRVLHEANPPRATNQEVQDAVKRELCVHMENATGAAGIPPWALAMQNQLNDMQSIQRNAATFAPDHAIFLVRNAAGNLPVGFPNNRLELDNLTPAQLQIRMNFYGLPAAPAATRLERLKMHLGIRP
ncbi:hypothetical protein IV203_013510 [Nitzschia inconspicua]|uniref:Uncharacterized protein n=1 Tax=Nitzschia inconspicua TaxID=303405 RepID=A0A9K3M6Z8_9STRA|nr:hypothetical protein IV203_013510 [Nitzschia inconspicua]